MSYVSINIYCVIESVFVLRLAVGVTRSYINKYGSYLLGRDWAGLKWRPVLKV